MDLHAGPRRATGLALASLVWLQGASAQEPASPAPEPAVAPETSTRVPVDAPAAAGEPSASAPAGSPRVLGEIIVTARRTEESIQSVPIAITAVSGAAMQEKHIVDSTELQYKVPTLKIWPNSIDGSGKPNFSVRGLSSTFQSDSAVVSYFAEVPLTTTRAAVSNLYDLSGVSVLKGPQGTLFGKNSTGGAILFAPVKPGDTFAGFAEGQLGRYDDRELTFGVDVPLASSLKVRIAGQTIRRGALQPNESGPDLDTRHRDALRLSFVFEPVEWLENYTIFDGQQSDEQMVGPITERLGQCPQSTFACVYTVQLINLNAQLEAQNARGKHATANTGTKGNPNDGWLGGITNITTVPLDDGGFTIKNIVSLRKESYRFTNDADGLPAGILSFSNENVNKQVTEELQLQTRLLDDKLSLIVGGYYSKAKLYLDQVVGLFQELPPEVIAALNIVPFRYMWDMAESQALFGQGGYDLSALVEGLTLNAGYRHTWDDRSEHSLGEPNPLGSCLPPGTTDPDNDGDSNGCTSSLDPVSFSKDSYTLGLDWQVTPTFFTYVASRRGYKSGGLQGANNKTVPFKPEFLTDVEVGLKSDFTLAGTPIRANLAVYRGKYDDIQVVLTYTNDQGLPAQIINNAAKATIKGFELEAQAIPLDGLELGAFFSYTKGTYDEYYEPTSDQDLSGTSFAGVPRRTVGGSARYTLPLDPRIGGVFVAADYYYRSSLSGSQQTSDYDKMEPIGLWNAQAGWSEILGSHFDLALFGKNLANKDYRTGGFDGTATIVYASSYYGEQRTWGASVRYRF